MKQPYRGYDVLAKWRTPSFDETTREVVARRIAPPAAAPRFFVGAEFDLLQAVVDRLMPQEDRAEPIPLAHWIDARLADGVSDGYRNENMPDQAQAWRRGMAGIQAEAQARHGCEFVQLGGDQQDEVLRAVQAGDVRSDAWGDLDPRAFFRHGPLRLTAALAYTHPSSWSEIGFGGPASPRGYVRLGFDAHDPWEAREA